MRRASLQTLSGAPSVLEHTQRNLAHSIGASLHEEPMKTCRVVIWMISSVFDILGVP